VALVLLGLAGLTLFGASKPDPCEMPGSRAVAFDPRSKYLWSCDGKVYVPNGSDRQPFKRVPGLLASDAEVLSGRFARVRGVIQYVALKSCDGYDINCYALEPVEGIDPVTARVIDEDEIVDDRHHFTVLKDHVITEPLEGYSK